MPESLYVVRRNLGSISRQGPDVLVLYGLLAKNRATGEVRDKVFAQVKKNGIESYYSQLSEKDKIGYHRRVAKRCMNYGRNTEALEHYRRLVRLQGVSFKSVSNMMRLKFRLIGASGA